MEEKQWHPSADEWKSKTLEEFQSILDKGSDLTTDFERLAGVLTNAAAFSSLETIRFLFENVVNFDKVKDRLNALHIALGFGRDLEIIKFLVAQGFDINLVKDVTGRTPILSAARLQSLDVLEFLIDKGADVKLKDRFGETPLLVAASGNSVEVLKLFLDNGVDFNARGYRKGSTPLTMAAHFNTDPRVIQFLIDQGSDIQEGTKDGVTPLMYAARSNYNPEVVGLLAKLSDPKKVDWLEVIILCGENREVLNSIVYWDLWKLHDKYK